MSEYEFRINISPGFAAYEYGEYGAEPEDNVGNVPLPDDWLALETAKLLERWLNVWDRIGASKVVSLQTVLEPDTFKIMGEHLWNLILDNEIGTALMQRIREAKDQPLRVLINFDKRTAADLRRLPWEFLCVPGTEMFLAAETSLLLTRYAAPPPLISGKRVDRAIGKLGVLFVTALPPGRQYDDVRNRVRGFAGQLRPDPGLDVPETIDDLDEIEAALTDPDHPCHVVHITGRCRGEPDDPKLWIDTASGPAWQPPAELVDSLFPQDGKSPRLVVLELSEREEGDADENFERLAPALIERGIPAVLAMQYTLPADDLDRVWTKFYKDLAAGMTIGKAVQTSRYALYHKRGPNRDLGTPVLYLREDTPLIQQSPARPVTENLSEHGGTPAPTSGAGAIKHSLRTTLMANHGHYSSEDFATGKALVDSLTPTSSVAAALEEIQSFTWQHADNPALQHIGLTLAQSLSRLEAGRSEAGANRG